MASVQPHRFIHKMEMYHTSDVRKKLCSFVPELLKVQYSNCRLLCQPKRFVYFCGSNWPLCYAVVCFVGKQLIMMNRVVYTSSVERTHTHTNFRKKTASVAGFQQKPATTKIIII